jgi:hypothetical protein
MKQLPILRFAAPVLASATLLCLPVQLQASTIWSEQFNYPNGALTNVSFPTWTTFSGTTTPIQVSGGQVVGLSAGAGSREDSSRNLDASYSSGVLFAGFDLTLSTTPTAQGYFLNFKDPGTSNFRGRVFIGVPTSSGFRIGLENDGGDTAAAYFTSDLVLGTTYRVVLGYDTGVGTSRLWVNNGVEASPTLQDNTAASLFAMTAIASGRAPETFRASTSIT